MKQVNLFGTGLKANSLAVAAENRLNCIYEVRQEPGGSKIIVRGTPGSYKVYTVPVVGIRGLYVVGNILYVVAASNLYSVTVSGVVTYLGALTTSTGRVSMSDNYVQLIIVDGTAGWILTISTGVLTQITDVNFPNGATTVTFLSGRFIAEKPLTRTYYVSNALDGTNWTTFSASVFANKEQYSDLLSAVDSFNGNLVLFGLGSIEFWQDNGTSPNPFGKVLGATQTYGLYAKFSRVIIDNTLFFLGIGLQGGLTVFGITSYVPQRVSTSDVEDLINTLALTTVMSDAVAMSYAVDGHDIYQITFPTANLTLIYDTSNGEWSRAQTGATTGRHYANIGAKFNTQTVFSDSTTGAIYTLSPASYSDSGATIVHQVTSKHMRNGGDEFAVTCLQLVMDTGQVPQSADYHITMEVSRDGGRTFGSPRPRTVGLVGQYKTPNVKWDRLGSALDFVFRFTLTDPIPFVITDAEWETSTQ